MVNGFLLFPGSEFQKMFRAHRGKVIYIPIVVPENVKLGLAHISGVIAFILLMIAASSNSWHVMTIVDQPMTSYDTTVTATISFGLRSFHVSYCEDNRCTFEDMYYSSCSPNSIWCTNHVDMTFSFVLLLAAGIGLLLSSLAALLKAAFLPTGHFLCAWATILGILSYRQRRHSFVPSEIIDNWAKNGETTTVVSSGYKLAVTAVVLIGIGVVLATAGYHQLAVAASTPDEAAVSENSGGQQRSRRAGRNDISVQSSSAREGDAATARVGASAVSDEKHRDV